MDVGSGPAVVGALESLVASVRAFNDIIVHWKAKKIVLQRRICVCVCAYSLISFYAKVAERTSASQVPLKQDPGAARTSC